MAKEGMTARQLSGAIRRAKVVYVYVQYNDECGVYIEVPKSSARLIVERVRGTDVRVAATDASDVVHIG